MSKYHIYRISHDNHFRYLAQRGGNGVNSYKNALEKYLNDYNNPIKGTYLVRYADGDVSKGGDGYIFNVSEPRRPAYENNRQGDLI